MRLESGKGKKRRPCFQNPDSQHQQLLHELVLYITILKKNKKNTNVEFQTVKVSFPLKRNAVQKSSLARERERERERDRRQRVMAH